MLNERVAVAGKYFVADAKKWFIKGFSYGPFAPNSRGEFLPEPEQMLADFRQIRAMGGNCIRVYHPPSRLVLDAACEHDLRVLVDVPWQKHRCFFEDWTARKDALRRAWSTSRRLGNHPALFAISVGNEIPVDVVRYYGSHRVSRFLDELVDTVKQESPECLTTYVNFPTTEFLTVSGCDFHCFNVYLHDPQNLGDYLDRLQHIAGNAPLVLGEYGVDTIRHGEQRQEELLTHHLRQVSRRGLAGSFIFSFTDEWFTGGHLIEDWAFGVTRRDRTPKPTAAALEDVWRRHPEPLCDAPPVSVVVCSYNGAATLRECLASLMELQYPDYEVILVDDGSTDATNEIAADFPQVVYHWQTNHGLSVARNVGANLATGEIVAYTDSDCIADPHWLHYLVAAMRDQAVDAIGGPNITPPTDGWTAKCVAASPGNPSHVMLDDRHAEHVPGCNMAFRRSTLLEIGGFDPQFRQAGDDVDLCWRLLDVDIPIGYASGAMVWHKRRSTVSAYFKQQRGYGRSEAMLRLKHPQRCGAGGRATWRGIIYGDGAVGLPLLPPVIYHGRFGFGPFQTIYRHNEYAAWATTMSLEWHLLAFLLLCFGLIVPALALASLGMEAATAALAIHSAWRAPLQRRSPVWCRPLVAGLYWLQPVLRGWSRMVYVLKHAQLPHLRRSPWPASVREARVREYNYSAMSDRNLGREALLELLVQRGRAVGWRGDFDNAWADWDVKLEGDFWHDVTIRTATEELGWPRRFTRCRCATELTTSAKVLSTTIVVWAAAAIVSGKLWAVAGAFVAAVVCLLNLWRSRRDCLAATAALIESCALDAGLATQNQNRGASASSAVRRRPKATFVKVVNSLKKKSRRRWRVAVGK